MEATRAFAAVILLVTVSAPVTGYKILFLPVPANSHIVLLSSAAEACIKAGHEAHVVKPHSVPVPSQFQNSGIHYVNHGKEGEIHITQTEEFAKSVASFSNMTIIEMMSTNVKFLRVCVEEIFDEELFEELKKQNYDFAVVDEMPVISNFYAVPHRLGIPYGSLSVMAPLGMMGLTLQGTYLEITLPLMYKKESNFINRLGQVFMAQVMQIALKIGIEDQDLVNKYIRDKPVDNLQQLRENSKLWLIDSEPFIHGPKHMAPNMINVGGISAARPKPLPTELQKFADSADKGLIIVSFGGSLTTSFPEEMLRKLLTGLGSVNYKSIIRLKKTPKFKISDNILITKWLPQNDLLGHKNTVLFITHCGMSSVSEAVYHGVQMLGFPNQDEQKGNAHGFTRKNFGLVMDRNTFTADELKATINKMMTDTTWTRSIKKASSIIQSRRHTAREEAVYWIEHVIKHGAQHLTPSTVKLAWYQILMLDIMAAILLIISILVFILIKCCRSFKRVCCGKAKKQKQS